MIAFVALGVALIPTLVVVFLVFLIFFERGLPYRLERGGPPRDRDELLHVLASVADAELHHGSRIDPLTNGPELYGAQLEAIGGAKDSVHLEQFIFCEGEVARRFLGALVDRARAGVRVRLTLDYAGSFATADRFFEPLRAAGGDVRWYQPPRWYTFKHLSNRTHRKLLVVDGRVGFVGGAGIADEWIRGKDGAPPWRDTMFRIEGPLVAGLQTCFLENWVESSGEILARAEYFPRDDARARADRGRDTAGFVVISAPQAGRSTRAHVVYQMLLASAERTIDVSTPYFLPDEPTLRAIVDAMKRGVRVRLLTAGRRTDHAMARISGRGRYGELLRGGAANGAEIYEYQPSLLHTKALVVDGTWCVVGSANLDNRSFGLNDEVFVVACDRALAGRIVADLERDMRESERVTYAAWRRRSPFERVTAPIARLLDRQS